MIEDGLCVFSGEDVYRLNDDWAEAGTGSALETGGHCRNRSVTLVVLLRNQPCNGEEPLKIAFYAAFAAM